jgi:intein/homing endonuclease
MVKLPPFIVFCERIGRRNTYYVKFPYNIELINKIKELPKETRKWNAAAMAWEINTYSLFLLIKKFKGSKNIHFDFGNEDSRKVFINQIKKLEIAEAEKRKFIQELNVKKEHWVQYKQELEETYHKYSDKLHSLLNDGIKLYPHQIVAAMFMNVTRNTLISHEMGLGKAEPLDSKLVTPNGLVRMGDIQVGDYVIGSDGKPKKVLGVYPQGLKDIYEITFSDGVTARSCDEHLWNVNTYIRNWRKNPFLTKTLREIIDGGLQFKNGNNKWYIPIVKPIEFEERDLKINPYVLGCLLGDGNITTRSSIGFCSIDNEIINEISSRLPENHKIIQKKNSVKDYNIYGYKKNNNILNEMRNYNLNGCNSQTKFIPDEYKFSSINQRLEILQGILDTDGHSRKDGIVELTLASKQLIDDVQFIVESLGGIGRINKKWVDYNGGRRLYWRINIKLPPQFTPFKLQRKIETFVAPTKYPPNRAITEVNYVGEKEAQCILIDSEDHLYVTDHCILTHNTLSSIIYVEMNGFEKVVVITPNSLKFNYYYEVKKFTKSQAHIVGWKKNTCGLEDAKYIIINYDFFNPAVKSGRFQAKWKKLGIDKIDCVILDECQKIKNIGSNTYKNYKRTFNKKIFNGEKESKIFLSGTPAPNRAYELYSVLNQISYVDFPTKKYFYEYYCGMTRNEIGWGYVADEMETKFEELYHKIAPFTHRKRKIDALKDLPDKTYQRIILEMTPQEEKTYNDIENSVANDFVLHPTGNPLTIMIRLRQYLGTLKINHIIELVDNILETGEKVVIVDYYKETLYELHNKLGNISALHTGDQTVEERSEIVKKFQDPNSDLKVFLASIQTANYGLTLTAASKLFIITLPYSVGEYDQVADRCILKGELVLSKNGYIPIESINIGDLIYTVKGNWKRVVDVGSKIERRKVFYDIKYKGFYKPLRCTEDHKIYVYDYDKSNYCWIEASDIQLTKHGMVFPKINLNNYDHRFRVDEYVSNKYNKQNINLLPILSNELLYAFGRFVGDGHINNHQVSICGHIKEYLEVLKCIETIKNSFNIKNHTEYKRDNKIEIYISSIELRNNFRKWFGEGAYNKQIPDFIFHLNNNQIKSFLRGYYDADGYERKNTQQASTVSKYLVYQLVLLEGLLNNCPTVRFNDSAKCWSIEYSIKDKIKRNGLIRNIDGNIIYPIQEIRIYKPKRNDERVYDLTIEDDESFIVGLSSVHNCHRIGQKDAVNIYPLIFPDTIDDYVYSSIENKRKEIVKVMDNEDYKSQINESVLSDVINKIKEKHGK